MPLNYAPPTGTALDQALAPIRSAVFDSIDRTSRPHRRLRPVLITVGAAGVAAALVVAGATGLGGTAPHTGASAEAATLLTAAAQNAITTSDPVVGPGQFLEVSSKEIAVGFGVSTGTDHPFGQGGTTDTIYIPQDTAHGTWTYVAQRPADDAPTLPYGTAPATIWAQLATRGKTTTESGVGGHISGYLDWEPIDFSVYSRDPQTLLNQINTKWQPGGQPEPLFDFTRIRDLLSAGNMPADLRSTAYRALTLLPGVSVVDREANLAGTTGVAIGIDNTHNGERDDLIIDPTTGIFIGERTVSTSPGGSIPVGTVMEFSTVTTAVVNSAP